MTTKDVLDLVQTTLDTLLIGETEKIYSFWGRRTEINNDQSTEYLIYTLEDDSADVSADGDVIYRSMTIALLYYMKYSVARTYAGRQKAADRMDAIREALREAGFGCSGGWAEVGDIDDVGFATFRSVYDIPRLMEGQNG